MNMFLELPRRREKPRQKPVCSLLQDILITRDYARMEVLPEHASMASPPLPVGHQRERLVPSRPNVKRFDEVFPGCIKGAHNMIILDDGLDE